MKKTNAKPFTTLTTKFVSDAYTARLKELADQQGFITRVLACCPGALESLCMKRLGLRGLPLIPFGNPLPQSAPLEDIVYYYRLKFSATGVLTKDGGGEVGYWNANTKKWVITISDFV